MIRTECPKCQTSLAVAECHVGQQVGCPQCGMDFVVTRISFAPPPADDVPPPPTAVTRVDSVAQEASPAGTRHNIGRFRVQKLVGEGGFGKVYKAYDPLLKRDVAIKLAKFAAADADRSRRFETEARSAGRLKHPNIVTVYETGRLGQRQFIVYEYVAGHTLAERVADYATQLEVAARVILGIADSLAYAHQQGVIHRDIKPGNIIIDADGEPHLTDFGVAKQLEHEPEHTTDGSILGTIFYMAPEQARGQLDEVGPASDQYSLGAVLYELITGKRPFLGAYHEVVEQVLHSDPADPRQCNRRIPRDLVAICLKSMHKSPAQRYVSVGQMAADLRRFLAGDLVRARHATLRERVTRWMGRNRAIAGSLVTALLLLCASLVASTLWLVHMSRIAHELKIKRDQVDAALGLQEASDAERMSLIDDLTKRGRQLARLERDKVALKASVTTLRADIERLRDSEKSMLIEIADLKQDNQDLKKRHLASTYVETIQRAATLVARNDASLVETSIADCPDECRGWEWQFLKSAAHSGHVPLLLEGHTGAIHSVAIAPDNSRLISAGWDSIRQWNLQLANAKSVLSDEIGATFAIAMSSDGRQLSGGGVDGSVRIWDVTSGELLASLENGASPVRSLVFSANGSRLVCAREDGEIRLWDVSKRQLIRRFLGHEAAVRGLALSIGGEFLASGSADATVKAWDLENGHLLNTLIGLHGGVACLAFDPTRSRLAAGTDDGSLLVWHWQSGNLLVCLRGHGDTVSSVCYSADGKRLLSSSLDGTVRIWDTDTNRELLVVASLGFPVRQAIISQDGRIVAAVGDDQFVRVWNPWSTPAVAQQ